MITEAVGKASTTPAAGTASHTPSPDSGAAISKAANSIFLHHLHNRAKRLHPPIHEKAMPVIFTDIDEQKLWLTQGDEFGFLYPFALSFRWLPDTLEHP